MGSRLSSSVEHTIREVEDEEPRPLRTVPNVSNAGQNHPMLPRLSFPHRRHVRQRTQSVPIHTHGLQPQNHPISSGVRNPLRPHSRQRAQSEPIYTQGSQPQDKEKLKTSIQDSNTFHCLHPEEHELHEPERVTFPSHQDCFRWHQDIDTPRRRRSRHLRLRANSLTSHIQRVERLSTPVQDIQTHYSLQPADDQRVPHAGGRIPLCQVPVDLASEQWIQAHHRASMVIRDDVAVGIPVQDTQTSYSNPAAGHRSDSDDGD